MKLEAANSNLYEGINKNRYQVASWGHFRNYTANYPSALLKMG